MYELANIETFIHSTCVVIFAVAEIHTDLECMYDLSLQLFGLQGKAQPNMYKPIVN